MTERKTIPANPFRGTELPDETLQMKYSSPNAVSMAIASNGLTDEDWQVIYQGRMSPVLHRRLETLHYIESLAASIYAAKVAAAEHNLPPHILKSLAVHSLSEAEDFVSLAKTWANQKVRDLYQAAHGSATVMLHSRQQEAEERQALEAALAARKAAHENAGENACETGQQHDGQQHDDNQQDGQQPDGQQQDGQQPDGEAQAPKPASWYPENIFPITDIPITDNPLDAA